MKQDLKIYNQTHQLTTTVTTATVIKNKISCLSDTLSQLREAELLTSDFLFLS